MSPPLSCLPTVKKLKIKATSAEKISLKGVFKAVQDSLMRTTQLRHVTSLGVWGQDLSESAWWLGCSSWARSGQARTRDARPYPSCPTTCRGTIRDWCKEDRAADEGGDLGGLISGSDA
ncbi:hypothetical protein AMECASPLE_023659 [Ameca splendens]|uniref:Uncharacterized protein n=1 Tax=Ameca splendens TaxID=208324 RepID=A0ABV0YR32_9TELE